MNRFPGGWWISPFVFICVFLWIGLVGLVLAADVQLSWTAPLDYTNGDPLPPEHILGYTVTSPAGVFTVVGETAALSVDPGVRCFFVATNASNGLSSGTGLPGSYICKDILGTGTPSSPEIVCPLP